MVVLRLERRAAGKIFARINQSKQIFRKKISAGINR